MMPQKAALIILDGWGLGPDAKVDAIAQAHTPTMDQLLQTYPHTVLTTHGEQVGLPEGQMGNSEVGHLNIGAGRVVYQTLAKINKAVKSGELMKNQVLVRALDLARKGDRSVHIMGLLSDGGVHSHTDHLKCLIHAADQRGCKNVYVHAFLDGRDTDPQSGREYLRDILQYTKDTSAKIASVIGRYYAMDRDQRWDRIKLAYDLLVHGQGQVTQDLVQALQKSYEEGITDEFVKPIVKDKGNGDPLATIREGDLLICFNFRTDRPRQISRVLTQEDFPAYKMEKLQLHYITMTQYDEDFKHIEVLFTQENLKNTLGQVLSNQGKTQVRIAETEKYPHVTFFFSGGDEKEFRGETRILIPSPKVATYDLQPQMSAPEVTDAIIQRIASDAPDFICLNYANADMVGHTGDFQAAVIAAETVDSCLGRLLDTLKKHNYIAVVIADHGNADFMINDDGTPNTAHTKNPVPCVVVSPEGYTQTPLGEGKLGDIAPTILTLMNLEIPKEMTGEILLCP